MTNSTTNTSTPTNSVPGLNQLALLSPQRFATPLLRRKGKGVGKTTADTQGVFVDANLQSSPAVKTLEQVLEVTYGTDPQTLIRRAVRLVADSNLRNFVRSVMAERDVNRVLTMLRNDSPRLQRLPIDRLRAAAEAGSKKALAGPRTRDTLYVSILIAGIEILLGQTVKEPYSSSDVIRSVVRDALRKLSAKDEALATDLRNCLGWGNQDDMLGVTVQCLQQRVDMAVLDLRNRMVLSNKRRVA